MKSNLIWFLIMVVCIGLNTISYIGEARWYKMIIVGYCISIALDHLTDLFKKLKEK